MHQWPIFVTFSVSYYDFENLKLGKNYYYEKLRGIFLEQGMVNCCQRGSQIFTILQKVFDMLLV